MDPQAESTKIDSIYEIIGAKIVGIFFISIYEELSIKTAESYRKAANEFAIAIKTDDIRYYKLISTLYQTYKEKTNQKLLLSGEFVNLIASTVIPPNHLVKCSVEQKDKYVKFLISNAIFDLCRIICDPKNIESVFSGRSMLTMRKYQDTLKEQFYSRRFNINNAINGKEFGTSLKDPDADQKYDAIKHRYDQLLDNYERLRKDLLKRDKEIAKFQKNEDIYRQIIAKLKNESRLPFIDTPHEKEEFNVPRIDNRRESKLHENIPRIREREEPKFEKLTADNRARIIEKSDSDSDSFIESKSENKFNDKPIDNPIDKFIDSTKINIDGRKVISSVDKPIDKPEESKPKVELKIEPKLESKKESIFDLDDDFSDRSD